MNTMLLIAINAINATIGTELPIAEAGSLPFQFKFHIRQMPNMSPTMDLKTVLHDR